MTDVYDVLFDFQFLRSFSSKGSISAEYFIALSYKLISNVFGAKSRIFFSILTCT